MEKRIGIVCVFDVLGTKHTSSETEILRYLKVLDEVHEKAQTFIDTKGRDGNAMEWSINSFSDTFIVSLTQLEKEIPPEVLKEHYYFYDGTVFVNQIKSFSQFVLVIVKHLMAGSYLVRGAISFGDFYSNEKGNRFLGSAVNDAASYFEAFRHIGIILTPKASYQAKAAIGRNYEGCTKFLFEDKISLKSGKQIDLFVLDYFDHFIEQSRQKNIPYMSLLVNQFNTKNIPESAADVYQNTLEQAKRYYNHRELTKK